MNIDEYRALKAQEESEKNQPPVVEEKQETPITPEPVVETTPPEMNTEPPAVEPETPAKLIVDGEEVTLDTIAEWKKGNMRNADYTQKTQELARQRKELEQAEQFFNFIKANPQAVQALQQAGVQPAAQLDPVNQQVQQLTQTVYDLRLQNEMKELQIKYPDFDAREVLQIAYDKNLTNLEDAYILAKGNKPQAVAPSAPPAEPVDVEKLRAQLRAEVEAELKNTASIISTNDTKPPVQAEEPTLSDAELAFCKKTGFDPKEYLKWKNKR